MKYRAVLGADSKLEDLESGAHFFMDGEIAASCEKFSMRARGFADGSDGEKVRQGTEEKGKLRSKWARVQVNVLYENKDEG